MKNLLIAFIFTLILPIMAPGQKYTAVQDPDILANMEKTLMREHPHIFDQASIDKIFKIDDDHSLVQYSRDGVRYEVIVNSGREDMYLLETAEMISREDLPGIIKEAHRDSKYGNWNIKRQYLVRRPTEGDLYRIDIQKEGSNEVKTQYYSKKGHPVKSPL